MNEPTISLNELAHRHGTLRPNVETLCELAGQDLRQIEHQWSQFLQETPEKTIDDLLNAASDNIRNKKERITDCDALLFADTCGNLAQLFLTIKYPNATELREKFVRAYMGIQNVEQLQELKKRSENITDRPLRENRTQFWADARQSAASRQKIAHNLFGPQIPKIYESIVNNPQWQVRRNWIYNYTNRVLWRESRVVVTDAEPLKTHPDLAFALALDSKIAELYGTQKMRFTADQDSYALEDNVSASISGLFSQYGRSGSMRTAIEQSLERLHSIAPQALHIKEARNPGLLLGVGLVLTEKTRKKFSENGMIKAGYHTSAKNAHSDLHGAGDEKMKAINFAHEVLVDPEKFARWKSGKLRFKFQK